MRQISLGNQSFESIRRSHSFYVDKTGFIKEWWENQDVVTLIARPRRFGKTLNLSMVEQFFSVQCKDGGGLFEGLAIWEEEKYKKLQGTYPVIFLSFAGIKGDTYETARESLIQRIIDLYAKYRFLLEGDFLNSQEREYFDYINADMSDAVTSMSLHRLSICLNRYYGKKAIILLDEYDTPLQEAYVNGYWEELTAFVRSLFNSTFKTNPYIERALMTGITRVSRESIFSDLNNLAVAATTTERYEKCFGFTEEEVFSALDSYEMSDRKADVKAWYDGFTFGGSGDIYNPWSITNFIKEKKLKTYWANTSSNALVSQLVRQGSPQTKMTMEDFLEGRTLETEIEEEIVFDQLSRERGAIWSLFLAAGYLKVVSSTFDGEKYVYELALTNKEVRLMFKNMVQAWFSGETVPYHEFLQAFLTGDTDYMNEYMNQVAAATFSSFDTGNQPSDTAHPERFYHGFVLGLIVELAGKYKISSNRESGFGRYDVMLEPLKGQDTAFVLEFKVRNPRTEKTLDETLQSALRQIEKKQYGRELTVRGIAEENIRCYGFAFEGKKVLIG